MLMRSKGPSSGLNPNLSLMKHEGIAILPPRRYHPADSPQLSTVPMTLTRYCQSQRGETSNTWQNSRTAQIRMRMGRGMFLFVFFSPLYFPFFNLTHIYMLIFRILALESVLQGMDRHDNIPCRPLHLRNRWPHSVIAPGTYSVVIEAFAGQRSWLSGWSNFAPLTKAVYSKCFIVWDTLSE